MGSAIAVVSPVAEALAVEPSVSVAFLRLVTSICALRFDVCRGATLDRRIAPILLSYWNRLLMYELPHGLLVEIRLTPEATRDRYTVPLATDDIMVSILLCCVS